MNDETKVRSAACSCGQLIVRTVGEPVRISMCHCLECQKRTGSLFGAQARWPRDRATIAGRSTEFVRTGDEGGRLHSHFCPVCGTTVWYMLEDQPDLVAVTLGAFADPDFPMPRFSVYEDRKHRWLELPATGMEHMD